MKLFDFFKKNIPVSHNDANTQASNLQISDLVQYVRNNVWSMKDNNICPAENFNLPNFLSEQTQIAETLQKSFDIMDFEGKLNYVPFDEPIVQMINPESVFDIKFTDSPNFWNHYNNSKSDYIEIASHIPEVYENLLNGRSLESMYNDVNLKDTVAAYFDEQKMIKVMGYKDGFQLQEDGRHRIMAAKELGYDLPVKILGEYSVEGSKVAQPVKGTALAESSHMIPRDNLPKDIRETFTNSDYQTVITDKPVTLYRAYGNNVGEKGSYWTTEKPADPMEAKLNSAILQEWPGSSQVHNTRDQVATMIIPENTKLNIGTAAPQNSKSSQELPGGGTQVLLDRDFFEKHPDIEISSEPLQYKSGFNEFSKKADQIEAQAEQEKNLPISQSSDNDQELLPPGDDQKLLPPGDNLENTTDEDSKNKEDESNDLDEANDEDESDDLDESGTEDEGLDAGDSGGEDYDDGISY